MLTLNQVIYNNIILEASILKYKININIIEYEDKYKTKTLSNFLKKYSYAISLKNLYVVINSKREFFLRSASEVHLLFINSYLFNKVGVLFNSSKNKKKEYLEDIFKIISYAYFILLIVIKKIKNSYENCFI